MRICACLCVRLSFVATAAARFNTMAAPVSNGATKGAARSTMTLPAGGKARAHTLAGSSLSSTASVNALDLRPLSAAPAVTSGVPPPAPTGDYFLVGEPSRDTTDSGLPPADVVLNGAGDPPVDMLMQRTQSMNIGRPLTEHEAMAVHHSYALVPPANPSLQRTSQQSVRQSSRAADSPEGSLSPPDERYVDLPSAQSAAIPVNGTSTTVRNPYQYPPPPRPLNPTLSAPATNSARPEEPQSAYSFLPPPRPASLPSAEKNAVRPGQYATLGPDDMRQAPPPSIDRTSKPRNSIDAVSQDSDVPPIDRGSKPLLRSQQSSGNFELDGTEFEQLPVPTMGSKRFSKFGYCDVPSSPISEQTAHLAQQMGLQAPVVTSRFSQEYLASNPSNYDIPPNLQLKPVSTNGLPPGQIFHVVDEKSLVNGQLMMGQMQFPSMMYAFDQLQPAGPQDPAQHYSFPPNPSNRPSMVGNPNQHYDYPPNPNQHYDYPPNPNQHYDYPPPSKEHYDSPPNPSQQYDYPPNPNQHYDYPPPAGRGTLAARTSSAGADRSTSPSEAYSYLPPPQPARPAAAPTSAYSYLPAPVKASPRGSMPDVDSAYSMPPPPVTATGSSPARPDKPAVLSSSKITPPPQFNPAEYQSGVPMGDEDQSYMVMAQAVMEDQYTDMSKLAMGPEEVRVARH